jgi:2-oxo-4-hydroxy-4-carboxy-5-ureidoimidazoline decarboxylase
MVTSTSVTASPWTIAEVNAWDASSFVARLGGVFEASPWIAEAAYERRPFADLTDLHRAMLAAVRGAPESRQLDLIRAHPDLVGAAALAGTLTRESTGEQAAAGLDPGSLTPEEIAEFGARNAAYNARFGFPFVICARENKKASILAGLRTRIDHSAAQERQTALGEIAKIAWYRLSDLIVDDDVG